MDENTPKKEVLCTACSQPITSNGFDDSEYQRENNLVVGFFGGYGMFMESAPYVEASNTHLLKKTGATFEANLCHECAHKLCEENPWLEELVDTAYAHSHTQAYWDAHPDHYGWDKKA